MGADGLELELALVEAALTLLLGLLAGGVTLAPELDFFELTAAGEEPVVNALVVRGWWITFAPPAVDVLVQYHVPLASAHACPSGAFVYVSL